MSERTILLNPGPVTLSERVRAALGAGDWCHREPEFADLTRHINRALASVYAELAPRYEAVMLTGSGTAAVEAMLATFAPDTGGTLVLANGVYGERMARMLKAHGKPHQLQQQAWLEPLDLAAAISTLDREPGITHLATVHHETTTGRLNDLEAIGELCRSRGLQLLLDGVSSFGAERIRGDDWNLQAVAATANKCLHAAPGISFVVASGEAWRAPAATAGSVYLDLRPYHAGQHTDGFSPFTQAVQVAFALREALAELAEGGGWAERRETYLERARFIHAALVENRVSSLLPIKDYSSILWSYELPPERSYADLHAALKAAGFIIYAGQGQLAARVFRIAHMGDIGEDDLARLAAAFSQALS